MIENIYCENYTVYYGNFTLFYYFRTEELSITKFDRSMVGFKDLPGDRYESHVKWFETYEKKDITKCYYLPREVIDLAIQKGLEYEKYQKEKMEEGRREAHLHPLKERFFESSAKYHLTKEEMIQIILEHKEDAKNIYGVDLPGVEYYEEWLNKYWH